MTPYLPAVVNRLIAILSFLLLAVGCKGGDESAEGREATEEEAAPVPVEVVEVGVDDMTRTVAGNTTLQSALEISVTSEIAGRVVALGADEGDVVEEGVVLARIVNDEVAISAAEARQNVERYRRELASLEPLYTNGYLSRQQYDEVEFQLTTAQTNLQRIQQQAADQTITAPAGGAVIARPVNVGEVVMPNQALFTISAVEELEATIYVPERELVVLREGQPAQIAVEALGDVVVPGVVTRINPVVDAQTGTVAVEVRVDSPADLGDGLRLRPGMFAHIEVETDRRRDVLTVPKRAIVYEADMPYLFVLREWVPPEPDEDAAESTDDEPGDEGAVVEAVNESDEPEDVWGVERVRIEVGYENATRVEVVAGVTIDDRIIVAGQSGLSREARVVVHDPSGESDEPGTGADEPGGSTAESGSDSEGS